LGKSLYYDETLEKYLSEIDRYPLIDKATEKDLARKIKKGNKVALQKLVRSNLRFVVSVAKKYQNRGLTLIDLISEGNMGLIRAAQKFDEEKDIRFISYAVWWIRQAILQALAEQSRVFRVPLSRAGSLYKIGKKTDLMTQEMGRAPTMEELSQGLDMNLSEVEETLSITQKPLSLETPPPNIEDTRLTEYLADEDQVSPDDEAMESVRYDEIQRILDTLGEREAQVIRLYFGLGEEPPLTLEEIGKIMGITRERVRQIKERALHRLRHISRSRRLKPFLT
jgi:RNA polymerase primary sigma factor